MKKNNEDLKRVRVVRIPHGTMLNMLTPPPESHSFVQLTMIELPEGATVLSVHNDFMRGAFVFIVQHPSFDLVEEGLQPPVHQVRRRTYELKKEKVVRDEVEPE
jgi:hypothetical protein